MATAKKAIKKATKKTTKTARKKAAPKKAAPKLPLGETKKKGKGGRKEKNADEKIIQRPVYISNNSIEEVYNKLKLEGDDRNPTSALYSIIGGKK